MKKRGRQYKRENNSNESSW